jgi:two-component system cell cycle response regulator CtrA
VFANDAPVALTQKEFAILRTLMFRKNMVLSKETLRNAIYGGIDEPVSKIIDVFVCKIRTKFAKVGLRDLIGTVWGQGYTVRDNPENRELPQPQTAQPAERGRAPVYS